MISRTDYDTVSMPIKLMKGTYGEKLRKRTGTTTTKVEKRFTKKD
jgi:hypothetical protein